MTGLKVAVSFLTRVPFGSAASTERDLASSVAWFPVVGALVGGTVALIYAGAVQGVPALVAAALAMAGGLMLTGAFHEDGLGDVADAFGGGWDREDALRIMKDPRHGTYGVLAIVLSLLVRAAAISGLDAWTALAVLPSAHALSRAAPVVLMRLLKPATSEGLGASYAASVTAARATVAVALGLVVAVALVGPWAIAAALCAGAGAAIVGFLSRSKIGGLTGDVLGAAQQAAEIVILVGAVAAITNGWMTAPWWR